MRAISLLVVVTILAGCAKKESEGDQAITSGNALPDLVHSLASPMDTLPYRFLSLLRLDSLDIYGKQEVYKVGMIGRIGDGKILVVSRPASCSDTNCFREVTAFELHLNPDKINRSAGNNFTENLNFLAFEHEMFLLISSQIQYKDADAEYQLDLFAVFNSKIGEASEFSQPDLRLMVNHIFARHGYIFRDPDLREYFKQFEWYNPQFENVDDKLSNNDKTIIPILLVNAK